MLWPKANTTDQTLFEQNENMERRIRNKNEMNPLIHRKGKLGEKSQRGEEKVKKKQNKEQFLVRKKNTTEMNISSTLNCLIE